jgi:hypothetical protein
MDEKYLELVAITSGYGDGNGNGDGDGDGYGYGDGNGYGYGDGYGDGNGNGDGDGNGDGYGYLLLLLEVSDHDRVKCFWRCTSDGRPANGGGGDTKAAVGAVERIDGPLKICTENALHGTTTPASWKGEDWWIVELKRPVQVEGDKIASLERRFVKHLGKCPF